MPQVTDSLSRARVSKDEGGLMLRDASQRSYACGPAMERLRCDAPQYEAKRHR